MARLVPKLIMANWCSKLLITREVVKFTLLLLPEWINLMTSPQKYFKKLKQIHHSLKDLPNRSLLNLLQSHQKLEDHGTEMLKNHQNHLSNTKTGRHRFLLSNHHALLVTKVLIFAPNKKQTQMTKFWPTSSLNNSGSKTKDEFKYVF